VSHVKVTTLALIVHQIAIIGLTSTEKGRGGDIKAANVIFPYLFT
jgi:hypothetical protein